jgi:hypothetical protein
MSDELPGFIFEVLLGSPDVSLLRADERVTRRCAEIEYLMPCKDSAELSKGNPSSRPSTRIPAFSSRIGVRSIVDAVSSDVDGAMSKS